MAKTFFTICILIGVQFALGQTLPTFEVATVKPAAPLSRLDEAMFSGPMGSSRRVSQTPGRIEYKYSTLRMLLVQAYNLWPEQISGPNWIDSDRFEIAAKIPPDAKPEQLRAMLQALLIERFQIESHRDKKTVAVYFLRIAKNGPKLSPEAPVPHYANDAERDAALDKMMANRKPPSPDATEIQVGFRHPRETMAEFTDTLTFRVGRPVVDQTNLTGTHDFELHWMQARGQSAAEPIDTAGLFGAIEAQLGLTLQAGNQEVERLVIDKANRVPISN